MLEVNLQRNNLRYEDYFPHHIHVIIYSSLCKKPTRIIPKQDTAKYDMEKINFAFMGQVLFILCT